MHLYFKTVQVKPKHPFKNSPYQKHRDGEKNKKKKNTTNVILNSSMRASQNKNRPKAE